MGATIKAISIRQEIENYNSHDTRLSDSSLYDEVCKRCGARDSATNGLGDLAKNSCPNETEQHRSERLMTATAEEEIVARAIWRETYRHDTLLDWHEIKAGTLHHDRVLKAASEAIKALDSRRANNAGEVERALRYIDADHCEHEPHVVLPWLLKAANLISSMRAIIAEKDAALKDCADDLEEEIRNRYANSLDYPSEKIKYERDMQTVYRARHAISEG